MINIMQMVSDQRAIHHNEFSTTNENLWTNAYSGHAHTVLSHRSSINNVWSFNSSIRLNNNSFYIITFMVIIIFGLLDESTECDLLEATEVVWAHKWRAIMHWIYFNWLSGAHRAEIKLICKLC